MCGIAGIKRFGNEPITVEEIRLLLLGIEHRGNHATGIALVNPDHTIHVHKDDKPAWQFCTMKSTEDFLRSFLNDETKTVILHTRWATQGSPRVNENNHPMFNGKMAVVHNGGIHNDTAIFNADKLEKSCETDSDIIRALLDRHGFTPEGFKALNRLSGSAAIAAITPEAPDELVLARSGSPLKYAVSPQKMWWASEIGALTAATRPWVTIHGLYARTPRQDVSYMTMPDNTLYKISDDGLQSRHEFKVCTNYRQPSYDGVNTSYARRRREWNREANNRQQTRTNNSRPLAPVITPEKPRQPEKKYGHCPKCNYSAEIPFTDLWSSYICGNKECKENLGELDEATPANRVH